MARKRPARQRRLYVYSLNVGSWAVRFKLRRFRTNPARRSRQKRQLVVAIPLLPVRELALVLERRTHHDTFLLASNARYSTVATLAIVLLGLSGAAFYAHQIWGPKVLDIPASTASVNQLAPSPIIEGSEPEAVHVPGIAASQPLHIEVPAIDVSAPIMTVGLNDDQTMETPPLHEMITGWYEHSPTPGEVGPSVIVGHVDSYEGPSVFYKLRELKAGDEITITRQDGSDVSFTISSVAQYEQNDFPSDTVFGNVAHAELRLITCGGVFDQGSGRYSHNTVVFATQTEYLPG